MRLILFLQLALLTAVSCGHNRQSAEINASWSQDSSKVRTLEAFLNIDYAKAFEDLSAAVQSFPDFSADGAYLIYCNRVIGHLPWPPL